MLAVTAADRPGSRLLVVEDDPLVRAAAADALRAAGHVVVEAANADEALAFAEAGGQVDLVFTDVRMPGALDGLALVRHLAELRPGLPVVVTSGTRVPEAERAGIPFVPKPYRPECVVALVGRLLGRRAEDA